ncbi:MAG: hypothetical protein ACRCWM_02690 [Sarcina sp.]
MYSASSNPMMLAKLKEVSAAYMVQLDNAKEAIITAFQHTLNMGYSNMFIFSGVVSAIAILITFTLKDSKVKKAKAA